MSIDVFISFSRADSNLAKTIIQDLEKRRINVKFGPGQPRPDSDDWRREIEKTLLQSTSILYIATQNAFEAENVRKELAIADSLPIKRFVAMIQETKLHFGFIHAQRANLYSKRGAIEYQELIEAITKHAEAARLLEYGSRTYKSDERDIQPLSFEDTLLNIRIVEAAAELIPARRFKGRASLLWVNETSQELYVIAATNRYEEGELRWRLKYAEGFAGEAWAKGYLNPVFDYPERIPNQYMKRQWHFTNEQIGFTVANKLIVSVPIYRPNTTRPKLTGILSLDSRDDIPQHLIDTPLFRAKAQKFASYLLNTVEHARPISYRNYKNLSSLIHTVRLFSPMHVHVRSAIFLVDHMRQDLFMLIGSEDFASTDVSELRFKKHQGVVGAVWRSRREHEDQRDHLKPDDRLIFLQKQWNMTEKQAEVALKTQSILAVPIWSDAQHTTVIGVLVVDSPEPAAASKITRTTHGFLNMMNNMAQLASKIIQYDRALGVYI